MGGGMRRSLLRASFILVPSTGGGWEGGWGWLLKVFGGDLHLLIDEQLVAQEYRYTENTKCFSHN